MKMLFSWLLAATMIISCSDDTVDPAVGSLTLEFDNIAGDNDLALSTSYSNASGEAYTIRRLSYYITGIQLKRSDGFIFSDEIKTDGTAGYYLVDEADKESQEITLNNIPKGEYTEVTFTVGVDANTVDKARATGILSPISNMFWNWDYGYIFLSLEGVSPVSPAVGNAFQFHVGGYKEDAHDANQADNLKTIVLNFHEHTAPVRAEHEPEVHLLFDVTKLLIGTGSNVSFSTTPIRDTPNACTDLAANLTAAFLFDHVHEN